MQRMVAIVCLTAFFALQYGKLVSYWHCRLINMTAAAPCDCVKVLLDDHKDDAPHTAAVVKEKTEEISLFYESPQHFASPIAPVTYVIAYFDVTPETGTGSVFQPPRS